MNRGHEVVVVVVDLCHLSFSPFAWDCRAEVKLSDLGSVSSHEAGEGAIGRLAEVIFYSVA